MKNVAEIIHMEAWDVWLYLGGIPVEYIRRSSQNYQLHDLFTVYQTVLRMICGFGVEFQSLLQRLPVRHLIFKAVGRRESSRGGPPSGSPGTCRRTNDAEKSNVDAERIVDAPDGCSTIRLDMRTLGALDAWYDQISRIVAFLQDITNIGKIRSEFKPDDFKATIKIINLEDRLSCSKEVSEMSEWDGKW